MKSKKAIKPPGVQISNCTFNGNTKDSEARLMLAKAIHANAEAARELAKNLAGAPLLVLNDPATT